jgi:hypothetical protein
MYKSDKRRKELKRMKKQEEKRQRRQKGVQGDSQESEQTGPLNTEPESSPESSSNAVESTQINDDAETSE